MPGKRPLAVAVNPNSDDGEGHLIIQAMFVEMIGSMLITFLYLT